jgi:hypothetical protein
LQTKFSDQASSDSVGGVVAVASKLKRFYKNASRKVKFAPFEFRVIKECYNSRWKKLKENIRLSAFSISEHNLKVES